MKSKKKFKFDFDVTNLFKYVEDYFNPRIYKHIAFDKTTNEVVALVTKPRTEKQLISYMRRKGLIRGKFNLKCRIVLQDNDLPVFTLTKDGNSEIEITRNYANTER